MAKQVIIGERGRRDFEAGRIKLLNKIYRRLIPTRSVPKDLLLTTIAINFLVLFLPEFQATLKIAVGRTKRIFPRLSQLLGCVNDLYRALLELDCVACSQRCRIYEFFCDLYVPVMVDPDFR